MKTPASRALILFLLGTATAIIYLFNFTIPFDLQQFYAIPHLDLGKITHYDPEWAVRFTSGLFLLFALYSVGWMVARASLDLAGKLTIAGFALLFQGLLLPTYPVGAGDVFDYLMHARVLAIYGTNPFTTPATAFPQDPFLPYAVWPSLESVYGPLWAGVGLPAAYLSQAGGLLVALLYYKVVAALLILAGGFLLLQILSRMGAPHPWAGVLLFLWNPLLVFEFGGNAHNDPLLIFFLLLSFHLLIRRSPAASFLALGAATLTKFVTAPLFVPLSMTVLHEKRSGENPKMQVAIGIVLAVVLGLLLYLPFWQGGETFAFLQKTDFFTTSPAALLMRTLRGIWGVDNAPQIAGTVSLLGFGLAFWVVVPRLARRSFFLAVYETLFLILVLGLTWVKAWYVAWLLAVAPLTLDGRREARAVLFSLTAFLSYTVLSYIWPLSPIPLSDLQVEAMLTGTVVFPVLLFTAMAHWPRPKRRPSPHPQLQTEGLP